MCKVRKEVDFENSKGEIIMLRPRIIKYSKEKQVCCPTCESTIGYFPNQLHYKNGKVCVACPACNFMIVLGDYHG